MSQRKKTLRPKQVPERTCVGCRETKLKRELIRIVRTESGAVEVDPTGKKSGRGAYLCKAKGCWEVGLKKERLDRALRTKIDAENRKGLAQYGDMLP
ncbi:MAG: YlxR family protein [Dehalococcoidia bacterium]|nr:YlxR family protein [Dehalococcoidia bacterium]